MSPQPDEPTKTALPSGQHLVTIYSLQHVLTDAVTLVEEANKTLPAERDMVSSLRFGQLSHWVKGAEKALRRYFEVLGETTRKEENK